MYFMLAVQSLVTICTELLDADNARQFCPTALDGSPGAHLGRNSGLAFSPTHHVNFESQPNPMPDVQKYSALVIPANTLKIARS